MPDNGLMNLDDKKLQRLSEYCIDAGDMDLYLWSNPHHANPHHGIDAGDMDLYLWQS